MENRVLLGRVPDRHQLDFPEMLVKNNDVKGIIMGCSSKRLIIVHTGSQDGFLPGGHLMYKAGQTRGNYRGETNSKNFEKWISGIVIPHLPAASVIVMDNAPYNLIQEDKPQMAYEGNR